MFAKESACVRAACNECGECDVACPRRHVVCTGLVTRVMNAVNVTSRVPRRHDACNECSECDVACLETSLRVYRPGDACNECSECDVACPRRRVVCTGLVTKGTNAVVS